MVGLILVCQRPAFGAENDLLKLRLAQRLVEGSNISAGSVINPPPLVGMGGITLRMSAWTVVLAQSEDGVKLRLERSLTEDAYVGSDWVGQGGRLQWARSLSVNSLTEQSGDNFFDENGITLKPSGWMSALEPSALGLELQLARSLDESSNGNALQSNQRLIRQRDTVSHIPLKLSGWMSAQTQIDVGLKLRLARSLIEDSYVNVSAGQSGLKLQLTRGLVDGAGARWSDDGLLRQAGGPSLRLTRWMEAPPQSGADDDDSSEIGEIVMPRLSQANGRLVQSSASKVAQTEAPSMINRIVGAFGMGLAPIRWGGYTSDTFRATRSSDQPVSTDHSQRLDLRANSYLWQPWFATVNGGLGISRGVFDSGDNNTGEVKSDSLTGFGDLTLFPQSRFPFSAAFSVSDSSTSSSLTTDDLTNKRYSLRQTYHPETGNSNYSANYHNSTLTSKLSGDDTVETLQGSYSNSIGNHHFGVDADHTETSRSQRSEGLQLNAVNARHSYSSGGNLSLESNARISDSTLRMRDANILSTSAARYLQVGSFASWRPKEKLPLNVTAGISLFNAQSEYSGALNESKSINSNLGVTYQPTRNLSLGASGSITAASMGSGDTNIITTENANASYSGDPVTFNKFNYNWNVSGGASNMTSDTMGSTQAVSVGGGHGLNREYRVNEYSALNFGANQSLSSSWSGEIGQSTNINHTGTVSWQVTPSDSMSGSINLSATDTRTIGAQASENQFISLQGNGHVQLTTYSSATANVGVQWNRQGKSAGDEDAPVSTALYTNGSASYQHSRAFGVNNLRYSLLASINMQQSNARLLGDSNADANPMGYSLEQHLNYNIGRIDLGLTGSVSVQNDRENALLFFRIGRSFGNY